jgi:hypothetical protein
MKKLLFITLIVLLASCSKGKECECWDLEYQMLYTFYEVVYKGKSHCDGHEQLIVYHLMGKDGQYCFGMPIKYE